ncbi:replication-relaxation family protein [Kitasatospora sp. NPDC049285]|uniref:replication-relaxation family protein n=1 Tax=Kitasatospora sp. NPDC049285 TaxID=3157096 RepID=UPI00341C077B
MLNFVKRNYDIEAHADRLLQRSVSREVATRYLLVPYRATATGLLEDEKSALVMLATVHAATVAQLGRYVFPAEADVAKRTRKASLCAKRLEQLHLIKREKRPLVMGYVLIPTEVGRWLSGVAADTRVALSPTAAPYGTALRHRLAVTELFVRLADNARRGGVSPLRFQAYPDAWRKYHGLDREDVEDEILVKPDAMFSVARGGAEQPWLVAAYHNDEKGGRISTACANFYQYACFCQQRLDSRLPRILLLAPTADEVARIQAVVGNRPERIRNLFTVATPADAISLLGFT